jgi:outer membrane protein OmpA-like peptidoglycan-associated protein
MIRTLLLICCTIGLCAQPRTKAHLKTLKPDSVFGDCSVAREIIIENDKRILKTVPPKGFGESNEFTGKAAYSFDGEHHSAWYKLIVKSSGKLFFDIIPTNRCDDYDFMLFKANGLSDFCHKLKSGSLKPVRACISRSQEEISGRTGLNNTAAKELIKAGVGPSYCKYIEVDSGDVFYLVLDNVYDRGSGHSIEFSITTDVKLSGVVKNDQNRAILAQVSLTDFKGDTVLIGNTKKDGSYDFTVPIARTRSYSLNFYNDSSIVFSKNVTIKDTAKLRALSTVLPTLKKGKKYSIGAINFYGDQIQYLPAAVPAMNNLVRLMKKNKNLKIKIIGHCNGRFSFDNEKQVIDFTKGRAQTIKSYLMTHAVYDYRIEIDGRGDHEMLYHQPKNEEQMEQNRRVEIMVIEY